MPTPPIRPPITPIPPTHTLPIDPRPPRSPAPDPATASVTSWTRIEPSNRDDRMTNSLGARLLDPLWMLTRQWQMGEFQAEDAGTPVQACVRATTAAFSRCHLGLLAPETRLQAPAYDPLRTPLDVMFEHRPMRNAGANGPRLLAHAVDAGLHFLRLLDLQGFAAPYRAAFIAKFALATNAADANVRAGDSATAGFVRTMGGRAIDGRALAKALRGGKAEKAMRDPDLKILDPDLDDVTKIANRWLGWYDAQFDEPDADEAATWDPSRMEYAVSISARTSADPFDEFTLSTDHCTGADLDWSSFDLNGAVNMGTANDRSFRPVVETTVPSPITFRGGPSPRFWELEDARLAYGLLPAGPADLTEMMLVEYACTYGNDWFVVPLTLPVGSVTKVDSLVVTDSFGVRSLLRPIGDPSLSSPHWSMWQLAFRAEPGEDPIASAVTNLFVLPPTFGRVLDGPVLEDVLFARDEMANVAWAIERAIENPIEESLQRAQADAPTALPAADGVLPRYRLASTVPDHWIPLLPLRLPAEAGSGVQRLQRGAVLQPDGTNKVHAALGEILASVTPLGIHDEEIPREGLRIVSGRRTARWIDGTTRVWTSFRRKAGRGEGSSGLRFDRLIGPDGVTEV